MSREKHAIEFVKLLRIRAGGYRQLYIKLHGKEPTKQQVKNLNNHVNRGNFNTEFILDLIEAFDLEEVTLGEMFKGLNKEPETDVSTAQAKGTSPKKGTAKRK
ncbi:hypothetical protein [Alteromonas sp. a30]|uniref:hypothetical protein n=1 Tax=Alteromonas sp. a30 TaxID=2730917 RepID=UPI0022819D3A|nr:hypothetical protein [Alteromonas sp. a30]MCY7297210.1 hypothetical protein [Alteromonas sp. a30]